MGFDTCMPRNTASRSWWYCLRKLKVSMESRIGFFWLLLVDVALERGLVVLTPLLRRKSPTGWATAHRSAGSEKAARSRATPRCERSGSIRVRRPRPGGGGGARQSSATLSGGSPKTKRHHRCLPGLEYVAI